jgi:4-hydroxy-3-methylbut-2-enyl diphosphate reductase
MIDFARSVDVLLLIGGRNSSNTGVLFEICRKENPNSHRIESVQDIDAGWFQSDSTVGITGSASTPLWQLEDVFVFLHNLPSGKH